MLKECKLIDLGLSFYSTAYAEQLKRVEERKLNRFSHDYLIATEHQEVYTYGRKSKEEIPDQLRSISYEVERGGEATYHNPGQLVLYPILQLEGKEQDAHLFLRKLEDIVIETIKNFGIKGERRENATGVWVVGKQKKIASIGVAFKSWISYHGLALNVENDLRGFQKINPCGFNASVMTSIKEELGMDKPNLMFEVKNELLIQFSNIFNRRLM